MAPAPIHHTQTYFTYFWDQRAPHVVKHDIERRTGVLFDRNRAQSFPLTYTGGRTEGMFKGRMTLRLEAAVLNGVLYSLRFDAAPGRDLSEPFHQWLQHIHLTDDPGQIEFAAGEPYQRLVDAALAFEAKQAAIQEDPAVIVAAQQAVLTAIRAGKRYVLLERGRTTHIQMEGDALVKRQIGERVVIETYATEREMLDFLRSYFDFEARRDTLPHKPPEAEIWKFIGYQFQ